MTDEDLQKITEKALEIGGQYASGAGTFLIENLKDGKEGVPPSALVGFGGVAAAGILATTVGLIKERDGIEGAKNALTTAMEIVCSMLSGPGINMDVSIQILVKEKPGEEATHRG